MSRKTRDLSSAPAIHSDDRRSHVHEVLLRTHQILLQTGHPLELIDREYAHVREGMNASAKPVRRNGLDAAKLSDIMARWYTDEMYVDTRGAPNVLSLRELYRLIRSIYKGAKQPTCQRVVKALIRARAVRRIGARFAAASRYVSFAEDAELAHEHSLQSLRRYLRTVQHNLSTLDPEERLLERSATNASIPADALPIIHRRFKREVGALLFRMDRYVRNFQVKSGKVTTLSLNAYASEDPLITRTRGRLHGKPDMGDR